MIKHIIQWIGNVFSNTPAFPFDLNKVEKIIGYDFSNQDLILLAFKHRSYLSLTHEHQHHSNERLEFLGDAVLDLIVTEFLYKEYATLNEGVLSKKKSVLVSRQVLSEICEQLGLGEYLLINKGEEKTGGRSRKSNLANLFEAILGAVYLDGGLKPSIKFVERTLLKNSSEFLSADSFSNYKSILLEYAQSKGWGFPRYNIVTEEGPDHNKKFIVMANVNNKWSARGTGRSKKKAEQRAAHNVLKKIEKDEAIQI